MAEDSGRAERLLAQLLIRALSDASLGAKAAALSRAGFEPSEIADLVGASPGSVRQLLYASRKASSKGPAKRRKARR